MFFICNDLEKKILYDWFFIISINSRSGKKKKHKKNRRGEDRSIPVGPGGDVEARRGEYPVGAHPPDTRYADMAPK